MILCVRKAEPTLSNLRSEHFSAWPYFDLRDQRSQRELRLDLVRFVHRRENAAGHDKHAAGQGEGNNPNRRDRCQSEHFDQDKPAAIRQNVG